ncbi:hypothetical protein PENTCL1PPCAC_15499 [Pristionchus entomophagus]|uniref:Secreted protein n=1 Tax=Pristionchus entomophagus TaxID=358040 RepID=A0AAV5TGF4_9BILA|nr:hypothetical protein PENTCL1PPCAC_15499 [Pristionchus entomophagus]
MRFFSIISTLLVLLVALSSVAGRYNNGGSNVMEQGIVGINHPWEGSGIETEGVTADDINEGSGGRVKRSRDNRLDRRTDRKDRRIDRKEKRVDRLDGQKKPKTTNSTTTA